MVPNRPPLFPGQDAAPGGGGDAAFVQSAFSPKVYFPRIAGAAAASAPRPATGVDSFSAAADHFSAVNTAAPAPNNNGDNNNNNNNNEAMLASLLAKAHQAEADAAEAEMQYFLSKRKAAMAAARAATQNYHLLQRSMASQAQAAAAQKQQPPPLVAAQNYHLLQRRMASRAAAQKQQPPAVTAAPFVSAAKNTSANDALSSFRRVEVEAAGAFLDLARGGHSPTQQKAAAAAAQKPESTAAIAPFNTVPLAAEAPAVRAFNAAPAGAGSPFGGASKAVTPELASPKLLSSPLQIKPPSLPPPLAMAAFAESNHSVISGNSTNDATKGSTLQTAAESKNNPERKTVAKPTDESSGGTPKRAFTAYNIFFAVEREKMLRVVPEDVVLGNDRDARINAVLDLMETNLTAEDEEEIEKRAAVKVLEEQRVIQQEGKKPKRKHRKSHGKVAFVDMTYIISRRWKALPEAKVNWYKDLGRMDLARFRRAFKRATTA